MVNPATAMVGNQCAAGYKNANNFSTSTKKGTANACPAKATPTHPPFEFPLAIKKETIARAS